MRLPLQARRRQHIFKLNDTLHCQTVLNTKLNSIDFIHSSNFGKLKLIKDSGMFPVMFLLPFPSLLLGRNT